MRRREFITVVWGAAVWPLTARSQKPVLPMLAFLSSRAPAESASLVEAFGAGLKEGGYVEGRNVQTLGLELPSNPLARADEVIE